VSLKVQANGINWLRVPDGWVPEEDNEGLTYDGMPRLLMAPLCKEKGNDASTVAKPAHLPPISPIENMDRSGSRVYSRSQFVDRFESKSYRIQSEATTPTDYNIRSDSTKQVSQRRKSTFAPAIADQGSERLEHILAMQAQLRKLTQQMTEMTEAVLICQQQLTKLTKGEY
jgi:hypothetical protein